MWYLRKMEKITWTEKASNEEILERTIKSIKLLNTIKKRQITLFGHVIRKNKLENLVVTGKIEGKGRKGRKRKQIVDQIKEWTNAETTVDHLRGAADKTHRRQCPLTRHKKKKCE